jgi:hypothetical protein
VAVTEIVRQTLYTCDACGVEHMHAPYRGNVPSDWSVINHSANMIKGIVCVLPKNLTSLLLCSACTSKARAYIAQLFPKG